MYERRNQQLRWNQRPNYTIHLAIVRHDSPQDPEHTKVDEQSGIRKDVGLPRT